MNRVALGLFVLFTVALAGCGGDTPFNPKTGTPTTTATAITSINFTANSVQGGQPITGTIVLNGVAGTGGAVVNLTSNSTSAVVPASFTIPAGQSSGTFQVTTSAVTANTPVVITSNFNGSSQTFTLTLTPGPVSGTPSVSTITFALAGGIGGQTATGTITLNSAAPAGGTVVTLTSDNTGAATVPATVTVPAGSTSMTFTVTTSAVTANTPVTITANTAGGTAQTFVFTVVPNGPAVSLLSSTVCTPGQPITVDLIIAPPSGTLEYVGQDTVPAGSAVSVVSNTTPGNVNFDASHDNLNFPSLSSGTGGTIVYTLTPPAGATGMFTLNGIVVFNTTQDPITGMRTYSCPSATGATGTTGVR